MNIDTIVAEFGRRAKEKLSGPGEREALITEPVSRLLADFGSTLSRQVVTHDQVSELEGSVRPDFGVRCNGLLVGHVELKAPGTSLDPSSYRRTTHNYKQWRRLQELPNLLHTNGLEWRLWRFGELLLPPVYLHGRDLQETGGRLTAPPSFGTLLNHFLQWQPIPITSVARLVSTLAPLARMLREEVKLALLSERRASRLRSPEEERPFTGLAKDWRAMLFPQATDEEFADGYAQTVTFALLLAVADGIDVATSSLHDISKNLQAHHTLMGRALNILTEHVIGSAAGSSIELLSRVLGAVDWNRVSSGGADLYLHLYEHFLTEYDPVARKMSGSYYTPVDVVDSMVALTDEALKSILFQAQGLRNPNVSIVDPAMGTGTYPLSIIRRVAADAAKEYGPGASPEAVANVVQRLYGLELQSGPFSVAELRITSAIADAGANFPVNGLNLYVADTLEDPESGSGGQLSYTLQLIARQRTRANEMKREQNIHVCIGNPPYKDHAGGLGGWIENGVDPLSGGAPLTAFKQAGNGLHERHLSNLYIYFWRWGFWKVFESTAEQDQRLSNGGVVCFITATGYLTGPGFRGMREYIRRRCSHGWIINLTPEGKQPPAKSAVFNIETPVAIALFVRKEDTREDVPAEIRYLELHGTRDEKFDALASTSLSGDHWSLVRDQWSAPFIPPGQDVWDSFPSTIDLFAFKAAGIMAGHGWVYGPTASIVASRLAEVVNERDSERKSLLFGEGRDSSLDKTKKPLAGKDTEQDTRRPFRDLVMITDPKIVPVGFRSFDRQYIYADSRVLIQPSPDLWSSRAVSGQFYAVELHSEFPRQGPGLVFSSLIPDAHYFRGSGGGRALPVYHPDGSFNEVPGLVSALRDLLGQEVGFDEVVFYVAATVGHPDYVARFERELQTPGVRVPMSLDPSLWLRAIEIGREVVWLHTYGQAGAHPTQAKAVLDVTSDSFAQPRYVKPVTHLPEGVTYDVASETLRIGGGVWSNVRPEVRSYTVGGSNVIDSWVGYRSVRPKKRRSSPLDEINETSWSSEWSFDLSETLSALTQLVRLEPAQKDLLGDILDRELISIEDLRENGMAYPLTDIDRRPKLPLFAEGGLFE